MKIIHSLKTALVLLTFISTFGQSTAQATMQVVTTTTDLGAFTRAVGGERVAVHTICTGAQDPHFVQARPSYMVKLSRADLLISVGLQLEIGWLPSLIQGARNPSINPGRPGYLEASTAITPIDVPHGQVDRSQGDIHPLGNPHFWLAPDNAKRIAALIADRLSTLDPEGAKIYSQNLQAFQASIDKANKRWAAAMAPFRGTKVVSYHQTFNYFFRTFGLSGIGYIEARPGIPPSAASVAHLIGQIKKDHVKVIFHESFYDRAASDLVARRTGAKVLRLPTSVGVSGVDTYIKLIDHIVNAFIDGQGAP